MKSSDGFKKNEAINMVKSRYYIKVEGEDAPTNVSPYIKLGMNVHNIAWVSTNQDAAIFPNKMMEYMDTVIINGHEGITLQEVLYETEIESVKTETFDILGTEGEKITVSGEDMGKGILVPLEDGGASVIWDESIEHKNIDNLLRIRLVQDLAVEGENEQEDKDDSKAAEPESISTESSSLQDTTPPLGPKAPNDDTVLTITGDGIEKELFLSMEDLKGLDKGYIEQCYSIVNNYPTRKFAVAKGISISYLLGQAGIKDQANCILVEASDGYKAELTKEQLLGKRYRYPQLISDSTANAVQVQPLLAWAFGEGQDFSKAGECDLRLVIGQQGIHDVNTAPGVQMVSKITKYKDAGSWENLQLIWQMVRSCLIMII